MTSHRLTVNKNLQCIQCSLFDKKEDDTISFPSSPFDPKTFDRWLGENSEKPKEHLVHWIDTLGTWSDWICSWFLFSILYLVLIKMRIVSDEMSPIVWMRRDENIWFPKFFTPIKIIIISEGLGTQYQIFRYPESVKTWV